MVAGRRAGLRDKAGARGHARHMSEERTGTAGTRAVFTLCLAVIVVGLAIMIVLPLVGR
ncbi:hypothetical protein ABA31_29300 [Agrococcus baldri]|uniref:Uncharacterized protein n=1 Tax=Agrococcus baldri TaxID=153730 RepID=A0AA87RJJ2_9MICO|nr:hypothetical protein ABA31_29300 [Agrococcus baldri]